MAIIMKKKHVEVVRKVNVKQACVCAANTYVCNCGCKGKEADYWSNTAPEADECAKMYYDKEAHFPIS